MKEKESSQYSMEYFFKKYNSAMRYILTNRAEPYFYEPLDEESSYQFAIKIAKELNEDYTQLKMTEESIGLPKGICMPSEFPEIIRFAPKEYDNYLTPFGYNASIGWAHHDTTRFDNLIFDIIYHRPLELKEYIKVLFHNTPVRFEKLDLPQEVLEYKKYKTVTW